MPKHARSKMKTSKQNGMHGRSVKHKSLAERPAKPAHRVTKFKPNGGIPTSTEVAPAPATASSKVSVGEAMRRAVEELGEITIDRDLAAGQLRELAELHEEITRRKAAYDLRAEEAKIAKQSLESAKDLLLEKLRTFTHPTPLPLFDQAQREADHQTMLDAAAPAEDKSDEPAEAIESPAPA